MSDILSIFGTPDRRDFEWLEEDSCRRLVIVDWHPYSIAHLRVKMYLLESPLQIELFAKKIGWSSVFKEMEIILREKSAEANTFLHYLEKYRQAAHLLLSEAADYGCGALKNGRANQFSFRRGLELKAAFQGIPAIIVGAGPSLEKNGHLLSSFQNKALILAGGSALNVLQTEPHFAASIDKEAPYQQFKTHHFFETPFCYQSRMNRENFALLQGERLLFPDGSSPALNWLEGDETPFDGGWTVGNFLTSIAVEWGCNPIVFVGMDLSYNQDQKYAHLASMKPEGLIEVDGFWTQRDWLMSARWTEELATRHPEKRFINATEGGMGFGFPIAKETLQTVLSNFYQEINLREKIHWAIQNLKLYESNQKRWNEWDESLKRCLEAKEIEDEIVYQKLLMPLWQVWRPLFERELESDPQPLSLEEKLKLNQTLFFQQVLQEHLRE